MITKAILAKELTESELSHSHRVAELCIDAVLNSISRALKRGERIELRGFGAFYVKKSAAHKTGLNDNMVIPEHGRIIFQPYDSLRKAAWDYGNVKARK